MNDIITKACEQRGFQFKNVKRYRYNIFLTVGQNTSNIAGLDRSNKMFHIPRSSVLYKLSDCGV